MSVALRKRIVDLGKKAAFAALLLGGVWNRAPAADEFALLKAERIGPLRVGLPAVAVRTHRLRPAYAVDSLGMAR